MLGIQNQIIQTRPGQHFHGLIMRGFDEGPNGKLATSKNAPQFRLVSGDRGLPALAGVRVVVTHASYSGRAGVNTSRFSTGSSPTTVAQWTTLGGTTTMPPGPTMVAATSINEYVAMTPP